MIEHPGRRAAVLAGLLAGLVTVTASGCSFQGHVSSDPASPSPRSSSPPPPSPSSATDHGPAATPGEPGSPPARSVTSRSATPAHTSTTTAARRSTAPPPPSGSPGAGPASAGPASADTTAGPPTCPTAALEVSVGGGSGGSAGSVHTAVDFVNTGTTTCVLDGHPGVSYVAGDDGHQVGAAAARDAAAPTRVVLAPGGRAHAGLRIASSQDYDRATCVPTPVSGYRVYPPDQTAAAFVVQSATACAGTSVVLLTVGTVQSGPSTS